MNLRTFVKVLINKDKIWSDECYQKASKWSWTIFKFVYIKGFYQ